jgi:hypothetical protein
LNLVLVTKGGDIIRMFLLLSCIISDHYYVRIHDAALPPIVCP